MPENPQTSSAAQAIIVPVSSKPDYDKALEGLRGYAALMVLYCHLTSPQVYETFPNAMVDPTYAPSTIFWAFEAGPQAVLLFFILSGYVIGLTNREAAPEKRISSYLQRRAWRLLPIYILAVIMGSLVISTDLKTVIGNLFFLQNPFPDSPLGIKLMPGNSNLWSLHNEVIYYLLFIPVWLYRPRLSVLFVVFLGISSLGLFEPAFGYWIPRLSVGFLFWLTGLAIAWRLPQGPRNATGPWPTVILICLAMWHLNPLAAGLKQAAGIRFNWYANTSFNLLDSFPPLVWLFLIVTRRETPLKKIVEVFCWVFPASYIGWRLCFGSIHWGGPETIPCCLFLTAAALRFWSPTLKTIEALAPIGMISYAVYALASPIQLAQRWLFRDFSGSFLTWSVRIVLTTAATLLVGWLVEKKLCPLLYKFRAKTPKVPHAPTP